MTIPLQYRIDGPRHAPVVLLVPPFGTTMSVWEPQMPELTRNRRVLRIDHRGHGSSPAAAGSCGIEDLALDVLALLEKLDLARVSAVGAGFAASLVVWIAANSPRTLERIALLAAAPRTPPAHRWSRLADRAREAGMESVLADVSLPWFTPDMGRERPDVVERFTDELGRIDPATFASVCDAVHAMDQRHLVAGVRVPALVVSAAHDPLLPPGHGRRLADGIADSRFEVVAGAAHLLGVERADRVNELLVEHVAP
ncbi:alpha/beta fold hydrolase [Nocardiopsis changdeensis]|uniref:Alpha/beta fold hydrolase n=1 Tax=Nocardiopsis changdeensis TaxID=2831969 RepID=A0ABX8BLG9_9ACTN|nr:MULTISPECIES: alpha/beta fold hydrolase [Nocardiopsis]QKW31784.1 alpha/beta fold hydrolase [Nocardiopsis flavescens]QUX23075.1 alpha/beta fold hydrolase [Nocardiopsis changdeensis]QYX39020.1 alpha/beta hydrolase [Nocardiopsis sp. MT53]